MRALNCAVVNVEMIQGIERSCMLGNYAHGMGTRSVAEWELGTSDQRYWKDAVEILTRLQQCEL